MTWAERVGDVATNLALVLINLGRIFTYLLAQATRALDGFVTNLADASTAGIARTETARGWVRFPTAVVLGVAMLVLRVLSIVTILARRLAETLDEFLRVLAEGEGSPAPGPGP